MERKISPDRLRRVWMNRKFTTEEVCAILMITESQLRRLALLHRLPKRHFVQRNHAANDEPSPEERLAQLERMEYCRNVHLAQRRNENDRLTASKVSKWRHGGGQRGL